MLEAFGSWADAVHGGDLDVIGQPLDWLGVNYYFDTLVRGLAAGEQIVTKGSFLLKTEVLRGQMGAG